MSIVNVSDQIPTSLKLILNRPLEERASAEKMFWESLENTPPPIISDLDGDRSLVTFVWKDDGTTESVSVFFIGAPLSSGRDENSMRSIDGTSIWYRSYEVPSDLRVTYLFAINDRRPPLESWAEAADRAADYFPDPLNPSRYTLTVRPTEVIVSGLELPEAPRQAWNIPRKGVPRGKTELHLMHSHVLNTKHNVTIYLPPGYEDTLEPNDCDMLLLFDGWSYQSFANITTVFDNLHYVGRIRPTVLVLHSNEDQAIRDRELPCNPDFHNFLVTELLPRIRGSYAVTRDPARTTIAGSCFGGLAATYSAFHAPELFGNVLSQSGSFWYSIENPNQMIKLFEASPKLSLKFSLEIGSLESAILDYDTMGAHRMMRDTLLEKGYQVDYSEFMGGHDMLSWRGSFANRYLSFFPKSETVRGG